MSGLETLMLPCISDLTGVNATDPSTSAHIHARVSDVSQPGAYPHTPNRVAKDSEASRNSDVEMALFLFSSIGTSTNDLLTVSNQVPPGGWSSVDAIVFRT